MPSAIYELIQDYSIVILNHIGKKGRTRLQEKGMKLIFPKGNIQEEIAQYTKDL